MSIHETHEADTFALKPISRDGLEGALNKAEQYRLLNHPHMAESICLDILLVDPIHQKASVVLLLALTDQFGQNASGAVRQAKELVLKLKDEYLRLYYF